jgi:hypothetical protein
MNQMTPKNVGGLKSISRALLTIGGLDYVQRMPLPSPPLGWGLQEAPISYNGARYWTLYPRGAFCLPPDLVTPFVHFSWPQCSILNNNS